MTLLKKGVVLTLTLLVGFTLGVYASPDAVKVPVKEEVKIEVPVDPAVYAERDELKRKVEVYKDIIDLDNNLLNLAGDGFGLMSDAITASYYENTVAMTEINHKLIDLLEKLNDFKLSRDYQLKELGE